MRCFNVMPSSPRAAGGGAIEKSANSGLLPPKAFPLIVSMMGSP